MKGIFKHWPLIASACILFLVVVVCFRQSVKNTQGRLILLDDTYIHMAMAKNFSEHGVWGVTRYGFSSSSSSLLWTWLLSVCHSIFGLSEMIPFVLNLICAAGICIAAYIIFRRYELQKVFCFLALLGIIFFTPLISLIFTGLEHTLNVLITLLFVYSSAEVISKDKVRPVEYAPVLLLAPLLTMVRFEGLFLLFVVGCLIALRKRPGLALLVGILGVLPIAVYGFISLSKGWYFLPNPVLLKGNRPDFSSFKSIIHSLGYRSFGRILTTGHIFLLVSGSLAIFSFRYREHKQIWEKSIIILLVFLATAFLHMQFAKVGLYYRYEAYLVCLGITAMVTSLRSGLAGKPAFNKQSIPLCVAFTLLILFFFAPFAFRGLAAVKGPAKAMRNIYEQQYQMGLFLKKFYQGKGVAANDIGAINYLADIKCLDLWGLASLEVGTAKKNGCYNSWLIERLARTHDVKCAIVYDHWFRTLDIGGIPPSWTAVGRWQIFDNVRCAGDTVTFYAVDPKEKDILIDNLRRFSPSLPETVKESGIYLY